jgi:hypothetical protein
LKRLVPDAAALEVERHALPNFWSLNFVVHGLLGDGWRRRRGATRRRRAWGSSGAPGWSTFRGASSANSDDAYATAQGVARALGTVIGAHDAARAVSRGRPAQ